MPRYQDPPDAPEVFSPEETTRRLKSDKALIITAILMIVVLTPFVIISFFLASQPSKVMTRPPNTVDSLRTEVADLRSTIMMLPASTDTTALNQMRGRLDNLYNTVEEIGIDQRKVKEQWQTFHLTHQ